MSKVYVAAAFATLLCLPFPSAVYAQVPIPVPTPVATPTAITAINVAQQSPATLVIPLGTFITVEVTDRLSSERSHPGDAFTAVLHQPIVVDGWVVARAGQPVIGRVVSVEKGGRIQGKAQIAIELGELILVDGQQLPIRTQPIKSQASSSTDRDLGVVVATTAAGALIGAAADGGSGAAIGAGVGAGAGVAGVLATPGNPTQIRSERILAFRIDDPVTISTARSSHAFLGVTAADYRATSVVPVQPVQPVIYVPAYPRSRRY